MAWNPSPEVQVARDAAKKLGDADQVIIVFLNYKDNTMGSVTYGRTKEMCADAKKLGQAAYQAIFNKAGEP
jgi:hypothetical protein